MIHLRTLLGTSWLEWSTRDIIHYKIRLIRCRLKARDKRDGLLQAKILMLSTELKAKIKTSKFSFVIDKMQNFIKYSPQRFRRQLKSSKKGITEVIVVNRVIENKKHFLVNSLSV